MNKLQEFKRSMFKIIITKINLKRKLMQHTWVLIWNVFNNILHHYRYQTLGVQ